MRKTDFKGSIFKSVGGIIYQALKEYPAMKIITKSHHNL